MNNFSCITNILSEKLITISALVLPKKLKLVAEMDAVGP